MISTVPDQLIICAVCDQSGSIMPYVKAYIAGVNEFILAQRRDAKERDVDIRFNCLMFNSYTSWVSSTKIDSDDVSLPTKPVFKSIHDFELFNESTYRPGGNTALYDAIGQAIVAIDNEVDNLKRPAKVIVMIQTDGEETASRTYTRDTIKALITDRTAAGWHFTYIAADESAFHQGTAIGIDPGSTISYNATESTTVVPALMRTISEAVTRSVTNRGGILYTVDERRVVSEPCAHRAPPPPPPPPEGHLLRQQAVGIGRIDSVSVCGTDVETDRRSPTTQSAYV